MALEEQYHFPSMTFILLGFVSFFAIFLLTLFYKHISQFTGENLPPGNVGYPWIGETLSFISAGRKGHPEKFISDRVNMHSSKVFKTCMIGEKVAFFCGAASNKFLFSNENKLVRVWMPDALTAIFLSSSGEDESGVKMRRRLLNFLKPDALQRYLGVIDQLTKSHFADNWVNQDQVHAYQLTQNHTFKLAVRLFISLEDKADMEKLKKRFTLVNAGATSLPIDLPGTSFSKAIKSANLIKKDLHKMIKQRKLDLIEGRASPSQDMLSHLLMAGDEDGSYMKESEIAEKILGTLVAGFDTVSAALTFIVKYLAELPLIYDKVYQEQMEIVESKPIGEPLKWEDLQKMKYSWNVAQEVMRMTPPVPGSFREVIREFSYNGFTIPKGWKLYWSTYWMHNNADYFPEPEKFDPSRFEGNGPEPYTYVPFGGGPRMCPGNQYAKVVMLVFMHHLVTRFKWEKVIPDEKTIIAAIPTPANRLPIRLFHH